MKRKTKRRGKHSREQRLADAMLDAILAAQEFSEAFTVAVIDSKHAAQAHERLKYALERLDAEVLPYQEVEGRAWIN